MNTITPFLFEGNTVRTSVVNDSIYFCARDLTSLLGYENHYQALKDHCDAGIIGEEEMDLSKNTPIFVNIEVEDSMGRLQKTKFINEDNMWSLVLGSRLEKAKQIRKWITSEVLPSIRKTGSYSINTNKEKTPSIKKRTAAMAKIIVDILKEERINLKKEGVNAVLVDAMYYDKLKQEDILDCSELKDMLPPVNAVSILTPTNIGSRLGNVSAQKVNDYLVQMEYQELVTRKDKSQYEPTQEGMAYAVVTMQGKGKWSGTQLKWKDTVLIVLREYIKKLNELEK